MITQKTTKEIEADSSYLNGDVWLLRDDLNKQLNKMNRHNNDDRFDVGFDYALFTIYNLCNPSVRESKTGEDKVPNYRKKDSKFSLVKNPKLIKELDKLYAEYNQKKCTCGKRCSPLLKDDHKCGRCGGEL